MSMGTLSLALMYYWAEQRIHSSGLVALVLGSTLSSSKAPVLLLSAISITMANWTSLSLLRAPSLTTTTPPAKASPPMRGFSLGMARGTFLRQVRHWRRIPPSSRQGILTATG